MSLHYKRLAESQDPLFIQELSQSLQALSIPTGLIVVLPKGDQDNTITDNEASVLD